MKHITSHDNLMVVNSKYTTLHYLISGRRKMIYHAALAYLEDTVPMYDEGLETTRALGSRYKGKSSWSLLWVAAGRSTSMSGPWASLGIIMPEEYR